MPSPVSTSACPLDPALDPNNGISFRAWKFRGLLPLTTIGAVVASVSTIFVPSVSVPMTFKCTTKCCCSSFRLPLLAVALENRQKENLKAVCVVHLHSELKTPPSYWIDGVFPVCLCSVILEWY